MFRAQDPGESIPLDFDCWRRAGWTDTKQLFAVWEHADVEQLIAVLQDVIK